MNGERELYGLDGLKQQISTPSVERRRFRPAHSGRRQHASSMALTRATTCAWSCFGRERPPIEFRSQNSISSPMIGPETPPTV